MGKIQGIICLLVSISYCSAYSVPVYDSWADDNNSPFYSSENLKIGKETTKRIAKYLSKFGYTASYTEDLNALRESIKDFQYFGGLVVTGELDSKTEELMSKNRCGLKDPDVRGKRLGRGRRHRRYNLQGTTWNKDVLTWRYQHNPNGNNAWRKDNPEGLLEDDVRAVMRKAMNLWEGKTNIRFVEDREAANPDVWVTFSSYRHNDPFPFDGQGGTLAHAFYPLNNQGLAGDVHFDDSERFTIGYDPENNGRDLMWVAVHELGHTLGLDHSQVRDAVMFPYYTGYQKDVQLKNDDTQGIQRLYGAKIKTEKPEKPKKSIPDNRRCPSSTITALWDYDHFYMTVSEDEKLYVLVKNDNRGMVYGNIDANGYYRIPHKINSVLQTNLGRTNGPVVDFVFTDGGYYVYNGFVKQSGPHSIHDGESPLNLNFPPEITRIDAAMKYWVNSKIYFFSGHQYWRYNEVTKQMDSGYPKDISDAWIGIPANGIDSAYSSFERKETFFTKGDMIYRIKERPIGLYPGYPKNVKRDFLKCEEE